MHDVAQIKTALELNIKPIMIIYVRNTVYVVHENVCILPEHYVVVFIIFRLQ